MKNPKDFIIVALDVKTIDEALGLVDELGDKVGMFKIGLQLFVSEGPEAVRKVKKAGGKVFLDLKFHDIPNTVGAAARAAAELGVNMFNVHASAGIDAMMAAVENKGSAFAFVVTVLTSLEENEVHLTYGQPSKAEVLQMARNAKLAGMDGIICSPQELELLGGREELTGLWMVTPGIRPDYAQAGDQKRVMTPGEAVKAGATGLVIGRPITKPPLEIGTPLEAVKRITEEIASALQSSVL